MTDNVEKELKPCPFCGGEIEITEHEGISDDDIDGYSICCPCVFGGEDKDAVIKAWNTRTAIVEAQEWNPIETIPKDETYENFAGEFYQDFVFYIQLSDGSEYKFQEIGVYKTIIEAHGKDVTHWKHKSLPPIEDKT